MIYSRVICISGYSAMNDNIEIFSAAEAVEVFNGLMLGDGGLRMHGQHAHFQIALAGLETMNYLNNVKSALLARSIYSLNGYPKTARRVEWNGTAYDSCYLTTRTSLLLLQEYIKWYPNNRKEVPVYIELTPISLAHWFMGDGSSSYGECSSVSTKFASCGFSIDSIIILERELHKLGLNTGRSNNRGVKKGSGIYITILQDSTDNLMDIIHPYMLEPYLYKIKYRGEQLHG